MFKPFRKKTLFPVVEFPDDEIKPEHMVLIVHDKNGETYIFHHGSDFDLDGLMCRAAADYFQELESNKNSDIEIGQQSGGKTIQ